MNEPLEVYIKKGIGNTSGEVNTAPTNQEVKPETKKGETDATKNIIGAQVVNIAKQGMMMAVRNYGAVTGRVKQQQNIESAINVAGLVTTYIVGGPILAGVVLAGQSALGVIQSTTTQRLENRQFDFNNDRLGGIISGGIVRINNTLFQVEDNYTLNFNNFETLDNATIHITLKVDVDFDYFDEIIIKDNYFYLIDWSREKNKQP